MLTALKPLIDSGLLNESTQQAINEAWQAKLDEAKADIRVEIRQEFAERYEHDKSLIEESVDKMVTESLQEEISKVLAERQAAAADRVKAVKQNKAISEAFKRFMVTALTKELKEFKEDNLKQKSAISKLEKFVMKSLAEEISEFATDKRSLIESKVKLIKTANKKFNELKESFVKRSSKLVQETVSKTLKSELSQLRNDINEAKRNSFGRKIYETFALEYAATQLNENAEYRKLRNQLDEKNKKLSEANVLVKKAKSLIENKQRELNTVSNNVKRTKIMNELLAPLNKEKASIMTQLLESVQTDRLQSAYDKYLPSVLDSKKSVKSVLAEATGNKKPISINEEESNIIDIKRLAGLN